jgi:uncharacterized protein (TIGR00645 family)
MGKLIESSRYLTIIGVLALLLSSLGAFGWGAVKAIKALVIIISSYGQNPDIVIALVEVVDSLLVATILLIFAANMYELFIADLNLPDWITAHNLHELKTKLSSVIVLVMAVKFLEHLVEWKDPYNTLLFGLAIAVVSAILIAFTYFGGRD